MESMNKQYLKPEIEIVRFETMDVITTSAAVTALDEDELPAYSIN